MNDKPNPALAALCAVWPHSKYAEGEDVCIYCVPSTTCTTCRRNQPSNACQRDGIPAQLPVWLSFLLSAVWKLRSSWRQAAVVICLVSPSFICHWCGPWPAAGFVLSYSQRYGSSSLACCVSLRFHKTAASSKYVSCSFLQPRHCFPKLLLNKPLSKAPCPPALRKHPACSYLQGGVCSLPSTATEWAIWLQTKSHVFQR